MKEDGWKEELVRLCGNVLSSYENLNKHMETIDELDEESQVVCGFYLAKKLRSLAAQLDHLLK